MVSIVASSLLIAPTVLHQVAAADEQTEELGPYRARSGPCPATKQAHRQTSETSTATLVKKPQALE